MILDGFFEGGGSFEEIGMGEIFGEYVVGSVVEFQCYFGRYVGVGGIEQL